MFKNYLVKLKESFMAVFPITLVIFALIIFLVPTSGDDKIKLGISAILLIIGMSLFTLGADSSMQELGENVGSSLSKSKKLWFMILCSFIIGFIITFAEPDLMVLANQVMGEASSMFFIAVVSLGVGIFLMLAICKIIFKIRLSIILSVVYGLILILAFFVPKEFMPIAFDSGSVTTGPISVPFLISFGLGIAAVRSGKNEDDSFGLIACCSAGPILAVMIMSLFLDPSTISSGAEAVTSQGVLQDVGHALLGNLGNVALVIAPILVLFLIFQVFSFKFPKRRVFKMLMGFLYTYIGIVLFLTGVECGYLHLGSVIGGYIGLLDYRWIAIPIGFLLGALAILAEPALHVLKKQVEDITGGVIKQKVIVVVVSLGVAFSVMMAAIMALYSFSLLYILIPVYVICIALSFFNSKLFTAVAFDSGGVATGAMAVSLISPLILELSKSVNESASGFGTIALIAAFPILTMQILGFIYQLVVLKNKATETTHKTVQIVEFNWQQVFDSRSLEQEKSNEKAIKKITKKQSKTKKASNKQTAKNNKAKAKQVKKQTKAKNIKEENTNNTTSTNSETSKNIATTNANNLETKDTKPNVEENNLNNTSTQEKGGNK